MKNSIIKKTLVVFLMTCFQFIFISRSVSAQEEFSLELVENPSSRYKEIRKPLYRFSVPWNWSEHPWGDFLAYTPGGAFFSAEKQVHMTHGINFGHVPLQKNLEQTTRKLISADAEANPHLQERSGYQSAIISGREALVTTSSGDYQFTGLVEIVVYYTALMPNRNVFYIAAVVPEVDYEKYQPVFEKIIESIQFTGSLSSTKNSQKSLTKKPLSGTFTGYVDIIEVNSSGCRIRIIVGDKIYSGVVSFSQLSALTKRKINSYEDAVAVLNGHRVTVALTGLTYPSNTSNINFGKISLITILADINDAQTQQRWNERATDTETIIDLSSDILFDFDKSFIKPEAIPTLLKLARLIRQTKGYTVQLNGYTDSIGSDGYNLGLSERRAAAVKQWLVTKGGINAGRFKARGYGESQPVAPNINSDGSDNPQGRQKNRRVEIRIPKD